MNIILVGESCVGKTEIKNYLCDNFRYSKGTAYTTRIKRENEVDGEDYYFITVEEFLKKFFDNDIFCVTYFGGDYYGIPVSYLNVDNLVLVFDVAGAIEYTNNCFNENFAIFKITADERVIERRKEKRDYSDLQKKLRKMNDNLSMRDIDVLSESCKNFYNVVNNTKIEDVCHEILKTLSEIGD